MQVSKCAYKCLISLFWFYNRSCSGFFSSFLYITMVHYLFITILILWSFQAYVLLSFQNLSSGGISATAVALIYTLKHDVWGKKPFFSLWPIIYSWNYTNDFKIFLKKTFTTLRGSQKYAWEALDCIREAINCSFSKQKKGCADHHISHLFLFKFKGQKKMRFTRRRILVI